jgi:hypothetical protein
MGRNKEIMDGWRDIERLFSRCGTKIFMTAACKYQSTKGVLTINTKKET